MGAEIFLTVFRPIERRRARLPPPGFGTCLQFLSREEFSGFLPRRLASNCAYIRLVLSASKFCTRKKAHSVGLELAKSALRSSYEVKTLDHRGRGLLWPRAEPCPIWIALLITLISSETERSSSYFLCPVEREYRSNSDRISRVVSPHYTDTTTAVRCTPNSYDRIVVSTAAVYNCTTATASFTRYTWMLSFMSAG